MSKTYTNDRSGQSVTSDLSDLEAATRFAELHGDKSHWLWYWIHKACLDAPKQVAMMGALAFLAHNFLVARGYGLKNPMIRLHFNGRRFKFYLSKRGTMCLKSGALAEGTHDPVGDEEYVGCLHQGKFLPNRDRAGLPVETQFLDRLEKDPIAFLAECSRDMGRCCYCNQQLSDPRSKIIGYGETCASHWGLPWGEPGYMEKAPTFSKAYNSTLAGLCDAVMAKPEDATLWAIVSDALQEAGLPPIPDPQAAADRAKAAAEEAEEAKANRGRGYSGYRSSYGRRRY